MTADVIEQPSEGTDLVAAFRAAAAPAVRDRRFWVMLAIAFTAHLLLLLSFVRAPPNQMGDPNAVPEAVAVSFVTEAELRDATTGADGGAAAPAQQPTPPPPAQQPPQPEAQPPTPPQPAQPEQAAAAPPPPPEAKPAEEPAQPPAAAAEQLAKAETEAAPETPTLRDSLPADAASEREADKPQEKKQEAAEQPKAAESEQTQKDLAKEMPELLALPEPPGPPSKKQQQQKKQQQKQAMRAPDMSLPGQTQNMATSLDGRSAGIQRPAGITRSGANDDFARGVIRALRQTMPQMSVLGRVTVRILINHNGNIESVEVLSRAESSDLNRAVVFSTKQASFPFPPNGATVADRTFTITYIYH